MFDQSLHPTDLKINLHYFPVFNLCLLAMSEQSECITRLVVTRKVNSQFISVRLARGGVWEEVLLDNYFPHLPMDQPLFLEATGLEIWPQVLEKAYAKLKGSYQALNYSPVQNVLYDLTGVPVEILRFDVHSCYRENYNQCAVQDANG